jgi:hypothetical protein
MAHLARWLSPVVAGRQVCRMRAGQDRSPEIHEMPFPRLTWAGLLIATLGWGLLLSYLLVMPYDAPAPAAAESRDPARFILIFGENAVISGFALAVLGALEKALHLLTRLAGGAAPARMASARGATPPAPANPPFLQQRSPSEVVTRGALNGRDYVLFRDGSVMIETLLGPRRFASIAEAQEFIGAS